MFSGSIVALITPMDENGQVCLSSLQRLVEYHIRNQTAAIVAVGTTGESATLTHEEHAEVVRWILKYAAGRIPVIAGVGTNSTAEGIAMVTAFNETGVVGYLSVTPYYNRPNQEGLYQHYKAIASHTALPLILYNVPGRTACDILPETVARLAKIPNIVGIKEATGDVSRVSQIKAFVDDAFILLSGDDQTALDFMQLGGDGVISVTANIAAAEMVQLCQLAREGTLPKARELNQRLMPLHQKLFYEPNPVPVKWAAKQLGLIAHDNLRLPLVSLAAESQSVVAKALVDAGLR